MPQCSARVLHRQLAAELSSANQVFADSTPARAAADCGVLVVRLVALPGADALWCHVGYHRHKPLRLAVLRLATLSGGAPAPAAGQAAGAAMQEAPNWGMAARQGLQPEERDGQWTFQRFEDALRGMSLEPTLAYHLWAVEGAEQVAGSIALTARPLRHEPKRFWDGREAEEARSARRAVRRAAQPPRRGSAPGASGGEGSDTSSAPSLAGLEGPPGRGGGAPAPAAATAGRDPEAWVSAFTPGRLGSGHDGAGADVTFTLQYVASRATWVARCEGALPSPPPGRRQTVVAKDAERVRQRGPKLARGIPHNPLLALAEVHPGAGGDGAHGSRAEASAPRGSGNRPAQQGRACALHGVPGRPLHRFGGCAPGRDSRVGVGSVPVGIGVCGLNAPAGGRPPDARGGAPATPQPGSGAATSAAGAGAGGAPAPADCGRVPHPAAAASGATAPAGCGSSTPPAASGVGGAPAPAGRGGTARRIIPALLVLDRVLVLVITVAMRGRPGHRAPARSAQNAGQGKRPARPNNRATPSIPLHQHMFLPHLHPAVVCVHLCVCAPVRARVCCASPGARLGSQSGAGRNSCGIPPELGTPRELANTSFAPTHHPPNRSTPGIHAAELRKPGIDPKLARNDSHGTSPQLGRSTLGHSTGNRPEQLAAHPVLVWGRAEPRGTQSEHRRESNGIAQELARNSLITAP